MIKMTDLERSAQLAGEQKLHPEAYRIIEMGLSFQAIGTLTFREDTPREKRAARFRALLRKLARRERIHYSSLQWVLRHEIGKSETPHLHFLLGGLQDAGNHILREMAYHWHKKGNGFARIKPYDPSKGGLYYVFKRLPRFNKEPFVAGERWDESREIEISHSILQLKDR